MLLLLVGKKAARARAPARARRALVCTTCERRITDEAHAISRGGAHAHTFVNPFGIVHAVRCFAAATGVRATTPPDSTFTWFPGYSWQILDCAGCALHIGWRYRAGTDTFYGLVADRLRPR